MGVQGEFVHSIPKFDQNYNYLLTGKKVRLFSRDKPEIFYCSSRSENNNSSRVCRGKKNFLPDFFPTQTISNRKKK